MAKVLSLFPRCLSLFSSHRSGHQLADQSSSIFSTTTIAKLAAGALICSSAGLGAYYAGTTGAHHGGLLAGLLILMALGLELAKPLAVSAAFDAFKTSHWVQGAAHAVLGMVAVSYSLTAELSLMATSRGDVVAERTTHVDTAAKASFRYDSSKLALLALEPTRPKAELDAKIHGLLQTPGANNCEKIDGKVTRTVCPQVAELKAERARAERREQLELTMREAEANAAATPAVNASDPGAAALAAYLGLLGLAVSPALLSELMTLVAVIALEAGSALALLLVRAVSPPDVIQPVQAVNTPVVHPVADKPVGRVVQAEKTADVGGSDTPREDVKKRVLTHLRKQGGKASGSQRGLAKLIGADKTTMRRALQGLITAGVIGAEISRNGTMLRLVA